MYDRIKCALVKKSSDIMEKIENYFYFDLEIDKNQIID